ncbi:PREDICTED: asparagine synthetase domain-containing protein 1 [Ceratosolen solmsi marchali]|uniref:Asparagine synthetase [glutamine-hydrolyzing] n=1 Tax=Ceratosolen solmsi marchali TaxID=326594 RepID=A0AAJ6VKG8_9HYME|nr:PREDICTED: asparagine synthetase domain-containing protein 1 [Ceratosolen solmsi marchali]
MCGIFCSINCIKNNKKRFNKNEQSEWELCKHVIKARGPDNLDSLKKELSEHWYGQFCASILWLQGLQPISQPLMDTDCNILLWNGDVFSGNMFKENICDSKVILLSLKNSFNIPDTLKEINGPFSFIYYKKSSKQLYFARDRFGRHSLLFKISKNFKSLLLTSVAVKAIQNIMELPAIGIFIANLNFKEIQLSCIPWYEPNERFINILTDIKAQFNININIIESKYLPKIEKLYLNILPTSKMGFLKFIEIMNINNYDEIMDYILKDVNIDQIVNNLLVLLNESVKRRVTIMPNFCKNCTYLNISFCQHVKVGILFSGGLDSAILAALTHNHININETIDLINVGFEKKINCNYEVPDRITGRKTLNELLEICLGRTFNFIQVDVSQEELEKYRSTSISNLVYPHATVLDDSLASAVWFASRAEGTIYPTKQSYKSTCRVLLLGMGADEQFGGYMRHRTILRRKGWNALAGELRLEFDRIAERNLGRDDRMVADHGRQSRLPYLDEDFVNFVQQLPVWERCCPVDKFPPGLGDKLLLRLLARKIKLHEAAKFPKRAFQFGSRIANGKENAKNISKYL